MSSFSLKLIACLFMLIDHIGFCLFPDLTILRIIGRVSFPIFAFQTSIGYSQTKNKYKYIFRMLVFAIISQIPFMFLEYMAGYNTFGGNIGFTFFLSLLCLAIIDLSKERKNSTILLLIVPLIISCILLDVDYSFYGLLTVILFYLFANKNLITLLFSFGFLTLIYIFSKGLPFYQLFAVLAVFFIALYNGKKGKNSKYLFYVFYPLHMIILGVIKYLL